MDSIINKILDNITKSKFYVVIYFISMSSLVAGNVLALYDFLITIPVLQWILNKEVLTVIMYISFNFIFIGLSVFLSGVYEINFNKNKARDIIKDTKTLDDMFNSALEISTLTFVNVFIGIVTERIEISVLVRAIGLFVLSLLLIIYGYTFNKYLEYHGERLSKL